MAQWVKHLPSRQELQETCIWSLAQEDPLDEEMAVHSSVLACKILWAKEPSGLQFKGLQRVRHVWIYMHTCMHMCAHAHAHTHTHTLANRIWQRWGDPPVMVLLPWLHCVSHICISADWEFSCCTWKVNSSDVNCLCQKEPRTSVLQPKGTGFCQQPHALGRGLGFRKVAAQETSWEQPVRPQANDPLSHGLLTTETVR